MKRYRLNQQERQWMKDMGTDALFLRHDWRRRLRNALIALAGSDPAWMVWLESEIDPDVMDVIGITRMVEARARTLVLRRHSFLGRLTIGDLIFRDWPFGDDGALTPG